MRVLNDTLGMTAIEFASTLGGHPSIYTKPITVIKENAGDLAMQLGQKAALRLTKDVPGALARGAWPDNAAYLQTQLGWSADEAQRLVEAETYLQSGFLTSSGTPSGWLAGPKMQYILQLCQEHLALHPTAVLLRHGELLRSAAKDTALRVTFIGHRSLAGRIGRKVYASGGNVGSGSGTSAKVSEINTSFMADSESEWVSRLSKMGVIKQEWTTFESKFLSGADWERVMWAEQDYNLQRRLAEKVEVQVEEAIKRAGGRKPKKVPAPAAATAPKGPEQAGAEAAGSSQAAAVAAESSQAAAAAAAGHSTSAAPADAKPYPGLKIVLTGEKVCLTGSGPYTRSYITHLLEKAGAEVQKAVGPTTNYLFCEDPTSGSAKLHKARSWGVKVLSYGHLLT
ncbi:hypothetical protein N2152v2_000781 [Parachlorella kessleri]